MDLVERSETGSAFCSLHVPYSWSVATKACFD
jgi:hypothetical protein